MNAEECLAEYLTLTQQWLCFDVRVVEELLVDDCGQTHPYFSIPLLP